MLFAFLVMQLETNPNLKSLKESLPDIFIHDVETARTILSVLIGGILSLTVFSFSMVMVVLNQASANYSPRLLPGLISDRRHQFILGFYIGYIIYLLVILISVRSYQDSYGLMGLSVMIAAILGIVSIFLFMYFIHSISQSVQVQNIVENQYKKSKENIEKLSEIEFKNNQHPKSDLSYSYEANQSGYYNSFVKSFLSDDLKKKENLIIEILPFAGQYVFPGDDVLKSNENLTEKEVEKILDNLPFGLMQISDENYFSGMIRLMEVAVKAMSPGINDPGTAIDVIHRLSKLLEDRINLPNQIITHFDDGLTMVTNEVPLTEIMRQIIAPIRNYSKEDAVVLFKLKSTLLYLLKKNACSEKHRRILSTEINAIDHDAKNGISNESDLLKILNLV